MTFAIFIRTLLIRKLTMVPKMKETMIFQPEDHASNIKEKGAKKKLTLSTTQAMRLLGAVNMVGIYGSGSLLFIGHELMLRKLIRLNF
ncbi:hypothetical protein TrLO_g8686 [Triparma laevis f. longispina]|uniref:Uncharacterized protein n=1 Tax=Triparma laevis f. longispina TaxID=1714387 RepID=A0A9W6ZE50_9STRA|nr:hypothetical protein TrLO_g8686 [Triparma laevis f. longispina]